MTIKDRQITSLQPKLTGDGEILIRVGDGFSSIDPRELVTLTGANSGIASEDETAKIESKDGGTNIVTGSLEAPKYIYNNASTTTYTSNDWWIELDTADAYTGYIGMDGTIIYLGGSYVGISGDFALNTSATTNPSVSMSSDSSGYLTVSGSVYESIKRVMIVGQPSSKDVEITDSTKGIILKSPNGTRYRSTISDVGMVTWTVV